jgi:hypothetical protein
MALSPTTLLHGLGMKWNPGESEASVVQGRAEMVGENLGLEHLPTCRGDSELCLHFLISDIGAGRVGSGRGPDDRCPDKS